jgi:hypothetical protein
VSGDLAVELGALLLEPCQLGVTPLSPSDEGDG